MSNPPVSPGFQQGQTLPANQLNQIFMGKQDYLAITQPLGTNDTTVATTAFVFHNSGKIKQPEASDSATVGIEKH